MGRDTTVDLQPHVNVRLSPSACPAARREPPACRTQVAPTVRAKSGRHTERRPPATLRSVRCLSVLALTLLLAAAACGGPSLPAGAPRAAVLFSAGRAGAALTESATQAIELEHRPAEGQRTVVPGPSWNLYPDADRAGHVAFTTKRDGHDEIYLQRTAGAAPVRLTDSAAGASFEPRFSPHGQRLAFARRAPSRYQVWLMSPDGSSPRRLTNAGGEALDPAWSPDGTRLAVAWSDSLNQPGHSLAIVDVTSGRPAFLSLSRPARNLRWPDWSPHGRRIAVSAYTGDGWQIWLADATSGRVQWSFAPAGADAFQPRFSPDGAWLLCTVQPPGGPREVGPGAHRRRPPLAPQPVRRGRLDARLGSGRRRLKPAPRPACRRQADPVHSVCSP